MTPNEKAKDLVDKFYHHGMATITTKRQAHNDAKQCALIAVEEILKEVTPKISYIHQHEYWQEVKNEIEKL